MVGVSNPYAAPDAETAVPRPSTSGELEGALAGDYDLRVGEVLSEAWALVSGSKLTFLGATLAAIVITLGCSGLLALVGLDGNAKIAAGDWVGGYLVSILTGFMMMPVTIPLYTGLAMLGVRRASGLDISVRQVFKCYRHIVPLTLTGIVASILIYIGFALFIIPGVYLVISYELAAILVVTKGLGPWQALETSRKAIHHKWFVVFGLSLLVTLVLVVSVLPLGVGLFWTMPLTMLATGVIYRTIFGAASPSECGGP